MSVIAVRHEETVWSLSDQHTGTTDIALTEAGRRAAVLLRPALARQNFVVILTSPLQRARDTCDLAGLGSRATVDPDLMEWNYGEYEGMTSAEIHKQVPAWQIFRHGAPGGETPNEVGVRVGRIIERVRGVDGNVALFAHGHILRVLGARWIGLPPQAGESLLLDSGTLCILDHYGNVPAIKVWNARPDS